MSSARYDEPEKALHAHSRGQLMVATRGLITVGFPSEIWAVTPGHAVWLPPHRQHSVRRHGPFEGAGVYIDERDSARLSVYPDVIPTSALLKEVALRMTDQIDSGTPRGAQSLHIVAALIEEIIITAPVDTFVLPIPRDARLERVARALIDNPADDRPLHSWARFADTTTRTLCRRFTADTGFSFIDWRHRSRLLRSLEMLATGSPLAVIARELGYASASAYINVFRRTFGETPTVYRTILI